MRMCQTHWDMLRNEVTAQGMGDMVSANGDIAAMRMVAQITGAAEESRTDFDPLMRCFTMIMTRTLEIAGLAAFMADFGCPICTLNKHRMADGACACPNPECGGKTPGSIPDHETWLVGPTSCVASVRAYAVEKGWL